jgi:nicotinamidase-related amidase
MQELSLEALRSFSGVGEVDTTAAPSTVTPTTCCCRSHAQASSPGPTSTFYLRRRGVASLIVAGVVTNGCIEQAIRQAFDLTYACVRVSDACGALTDEIHENALERLANRRAHVLPIDAVLSAPITPATEIALVRSPAAS